MHESVTLHHGCRWFKWFSKPATITF